MRRKLASNMLPKHSFITPQALMSTKLLKHIVDLSHNQVLKTTTDLQNQITWAFLDTYGMQIIALIHQFCPPRTTTLLFTREPLQCVSNVSANTSASTTSTAAGKGQQKCKGCGVAGHYREYCFIFISYNH